jgi:hypothetical protein
MGYASQCLGLDRHQLMNYPQPPPGTLRTRLNAWLENPTFHGWFLRACAGLLSIGLLFLALLLWAVGSMYSPSSHDGLQPPSGDIQYYLALAAVVACMVAASVAFAHAITGRWGRAALTTLAIALAAAGVWRVVLVHFCPDC